MKDNKPFSVWDIDGVEFKVYLAGSEEMADNIGVCSGSAAVIYMHREISSPTLFSQTLLHELTHAYVYTRNIGNGVNTDARTSIDLTHEQAVCRFSASFYSLIADNPTSFSDYIFPGKKVASLLKK